MILESSVILLHAFLYGLMEIEMEGSAGWMYHSPTQCTSFLRFTHYHMYMNALILMTVFFILRPILTRDFMSNLSAWLYHVVIYFIVEDETWFLFNGIEYGTAPWQTHTVWVSMVAVWLSFIWFVIEWRVEMITFAMLMVVNILVSIYALGTFNTPYNINIHANVTSRNNHCG